MRSRWCHGRQSWRWLGLRVLVGLTSSRFRHAAQTEAKLGPPSKKDRQQWPRQTADTPFSWAGDGKVIQPVVVASSFSQIFIAALEARAGAYRRLIEGCPHATWLLRRASQCAPRIELPRNPNQTVYRQDRRELEDMSGRQMHATPRRGFRESARRLLRGYR
jgi:hypothetical protein